LSLSINGIDCRTIHFTGIFGSGMSALAQYLQWQGLSVSGSDRLLSSEDSANVHNKLLQMGCVLFDQDGSGITHATDIICISTAIEESNPDIAAARKLSIPILHRSDVLAAIVGSKKTIAIAGTSGKSTVTAMVFELLTACGKAPSLISGANLRRLEKGGYIGNAFHGTSEYLVIEADESDGTLVKYHPFISVILNVSKDHKTIPEIIELFKELSANSLTTIINADDVYLRQIPSKNTFGLLEQAAWHPDSHRLETISGILMRNGVEFRLPLPGYHNLSNLCASLAVCEHLNCDEKQLSDAVGAYQGVARRFTILTTGDAVHVVDDFAHNPEKIKAAVAAARNLSSRIIAVYQPHGFGPTRFLKEEYLNTFRMIFTPKDSLYLLPIYYAGGTAQKDISSQILLSALGDVPFQTFAPQSREALLSLLDRDVSRGDCVLLMGARDPSLSPFAQKIADHFGRTET
jgi:UDP-N-acetylmuramate--alanine ligase